MLRLEQSRGTRVKCGFDGEDKVLELTGGKS